MVFARNCLRGGTLFLAALLAVALGPLAVKAQETPPLPSARPSDPEWVGVWGTNRLVCSSALRTSLSLPLNFSADGDYLILGRGTFDGYEWGCTIKEITGAANKVRLSGQCAAEGEEYDHWIEIELVGDGEYLLVVHEGSPNASSLQRCLTADLQEETADTWHAYSPHEAPFGVYVAAFLRAVAEVCPGVTANEDVLSVIEAISRTKLAGARFGNADFTYNYGRERGIAEATHVPGACDAVVQLFGNAGTIYPRLLKHRDS